MATLGSLLIRVGVRLDGELKAEQSLKRLKMASRDYGKTAETATTRSGRAWQRMSNRIRAAAARAQRSIHGLVERMGGWKNVLLGAGAAVAGATAATFRFVDQQTAALDVVNKTRLAVGAGAEEYQKLKFAASQSGVETAVLDKALRNLNKNLLDVAGGSGKRTADALGALGLQLSDLEGKTRTQQIGLIADELKKVTDEGQRSALAARIFGERSGPQLATLLAEGSDGIAKLAAMAGDVFTEDQLNAATAFQDRLGELKSEVRGLAGTIAVELLPEFEDAVIGMRDWIHENRVFIEQGTDKAVRFLSEEVGEFGRVAGAAAQIVNGLTSNLDFLGTTINVDTIPGLGWLSDAVWRSINPWANLSGAILDVRNRLVEVGAISDVVAGGGLGNAAGRVQKALRELERNAPKLTPDAQVYGPQIQNAGAAPPRRRGGGGGRKRDKPERKKREKAKKETSGVTWQQAVAALSAGNPEVIQERLKGISAGTPEARDIKPTVAMTVNITNNDVDVEQHIRATDPVSAGREAATSIERLFSRAGLALANPVVL